MIKITGRFNEALVFTDVIEERAMAQIKAMCDFEPLAGSKIRIMPDVHAGIGCTIGTAMTVNDVVVPDMVGVDIGCGMELIELEERKIDFAALDEFIRGHIPSGMKVRDCPHTMAKLTHIEGLKCAPYADLALSARSIGTLGGGNHFIEVDSDEEGRLYLVIHSGSRHLGVEVAEYYKKVAIGELQAKRERRIRAVAKQLEAEGRQTEIPAAILKIRREADIPRELAYLTGGSMADYIHDMKIVQEYASINRRAIAADILSALGLKARGGFSTIHNYIDTDSMILRKGAVSARLGERLLIPINMRDGSLICSGLGNDGWNCSAPHGAGRIMSRGEAFATLTVEQFREQMSGIYSTSVGLDTLDESPMAYKTMGSIVSNIAPTARIERRILPVYNFKAGGGRPWQNKRAQPK